MTLGTSLLLLLFWQTNWARVLQLPISDCDSLYILTVILILPLCIYIKVLSPTNGQFVTDLLHFYDSTYISPQLEFPTFWLSDTWSQKFPFIYLLICFPSLLPCCRLWVAALKTMYRDYTVSHKTTDPSVPDKIIYSPLDIMGVLDHSWVPLYHNKSIQSKYIIMRPLDTILDFVMNSWH